MTKAERGPRTILGRKIPEPHGYWILDYLPPLQRSNTEIQLSRSDKILQALDSLQADGISAATPEHILQRVRQLHPSRVPMYLPRWDSALDKLLNSGEIVGIRNMDYLKDNSFNRLYRRATEAEKEELARNRRNDLPRVVYPRTFGF